MAQKILLSIITILYIMIMKSKMI